jgi:uncharacterized LabA/DUF88 family protein
MKIVVIFVDHENLSICARQKGINVDYRAFKEYLADEREGRILREAFCYVAIDPRREHGKDEEIQRMKKDGWIVKAKVGAPIPNGKFKCNVDVELTMEMLKFSYEVRPDIVVLVTGDQDFAAPVQNLRERGIRVEVAAFTENVSYVLRNAASSFINLELYFPKQNSRDWYKKLWKRLKGSAG